MTPAKIWLIAVALLSFSGCLRVHRFNQRQYGECVKAHGGETWMWNGLPLTCKALPYPACQETGLGQICRGIQAEPIDELISGDPK